MTTDTDRLFDMDEAMGRIGALAWRAWHEGEPGFAEVVEEVVLTFDDLLDGVGADSLRAKVEEILLPEWLPHLPFQERLRKLVELRRSWLNWSAAQEARILELELMTNRIGDPPLAVDPDSLVRLRLLLRNDPRTLILTGPLIELLKGMVGFTTGPTHIEPAILCPHCKGTCVIVDDRMGPFPCVRCDGEGKVADVEAMRLRIAELEHERGQLRNVMHKANSLMAWMRSPNDCPPQEVWEGLEQSLADHRNNGYENSDHPDDFTAPTWSAADEPADSPEAT